MEIKYCRFNVQSEFQEPADFKDNQTFKAPVACCQSMDNYCSDNLSIYLFFQLNSTPLLTNKRKSQKIISPTYPTATIPWPLQLDS